MAFKNRCDHCGSRRGAYEVQGKHIARVELATVYKDNNPRNRQEGNVLTLCQGCLRRFEDEQNATPQQQRLF